MSTDIETKNSNFIQLEGTVSRITFHNAENGFCVLRVEVANYPEPIVVVGNTPTIMVGEHISFTGHWQQDKTYGQQFKSHHLISIPPTTKNGMEKYLGSGLIKGIGPHLAHILIETFGEEVFTILEEKPERLLELPGVGKKRLQQIVASWNEQRQIRDIMIFLQTYGLGTARAVRIYKTYGHESIAKVKENPYQLVWDLPGFGFKTADLLASQLGIMKNSLGRASAGVRHVLYEYCDYGHCAMQYEQLVHASISLLNIDEDIIRTAIKSEIENKNLISEDIEDVLCIFPNSLYYSEAQSANHLLRIQKGNLPWGKIDVSKLIPEVEKRSGLELAESQKAAIHKVLKHKISILTGGPGVGKTTIVSSILKIVQTKALSIALCAPTGRAAKRLSETTGLSAKTIHRLLMFQPDVGTFKHCLINPLPIDFLIIDEVSMVDIVLLNHLLQAVPLHAAILFVGDVDQLPSVGSGAVLHDLIHSEVIPTVRLTEIFRQAAHSKIIVNAHRINEGLMPLPNELSDSDFYTIYAETPEEIQQQLIDLVSLRLPTYTARDAISDIQVITPMNRGNLGTVLLNTYLQKVLNGQAEPKITRFGMTFAPGDKVIQIINNYEKEIFNGDIGFVTQVNLEDNVVRIAFDQRVIDYDFNDLDELSLAYAISIHKSQGSEFPIVVIPIVMQHYMLLARNLLYTGVTRGKELVVLIGQKKAIQIAVTNNRENNRLTKLAQRLKN